MHELPKELTHSLRSWRGSVYGALPKRDPNDLEKGPDDPGEKLSPQSSMVLVCSSSMAHRDMLYSMPNAHMRPASNSLISCASA